MPPKQKSEKEVELDLARKEAIRNDEQLKDIGEEIATYGDADAFSKSKGGEKIIASLKSDVFDAVMLLTVKYKKANHIELISLCASLETKMDLLRRMTQAGKRKDEAVKSFDERLKEILAA